MNWEVKDNYLVKEIDFSDQTSLADFFMKVARLADKKNHHPDIEVSKCCHLTLRLTTHSKGKITHLDEELAKEIDTIKF